MVVGYYRLEPGTAIKEVVRRWVDLGQKAYDDSMPQLYSSAELWPYRAHHRDWMRPEQKKALVEEFKEHGWDPENPLHLEIGRRHGYARIAEGNHRLAIARAIRGVEVPVTFHFHQTVLPRDDDFFIRESRFMKENPPAKVTYLYVMPGRRTPKACGSQQAGWFQQHAKYFYEAPGMTAAEARQAIKDGHLRPTYVEGRPAAVDLQTGKVKKRAALPEPSDDKRVIEAYTLRDLLMAAEAWMKASWTYHWAALGFAEQFYINEIVGAYERHGDGRILAKLVVPRGPLAVYQPYGRNYESHSSYVIKWHRAASRITYDQKEMTQGDLIAHANVEDHVMLELYTQSSSGVDQLKRAQTWVLPRPVTRRDIEGLA
jgi:hypothetical protein